MARRRKGNPVHGWVVLDKPRGMTSTQAVGAVRQLFSAQKAGHAGTLDPLATGVLPIALGEATKTVSFVVGGSKTYRFTVRWGLETDTDDSHGVALGTSEQRPSPSAIRAVLPKFIGEVMQAPPAYSAIKVDGARAYDLARSGQAAVLEPRPVVIERFELVEAPEPDIAVFEVDCGKGTYVRALARDMGRLLGCGGHVVELRRTRVGAFTDSLAISLEELRDGVGHSGEECLAEMLLPIETALDGLLQINVSRMDAARLLNGQPVLLRGRDAPIAIGDAYAVAQGLLVALCEVSQGELRPTRVFNYG